MIKREKICISSKCPICQRQMLSLMFGKSMAYFYCPNVGVNRWASSHYRRKFGFNTMTEILNINSYMIINDFVGNTCRVTRRQKNEKSTFIVFEKIIPIIPEELNRLERNWDKYILMK